MSREVTINVKNRSNIKTEKEGLCFYILPNFRWVSQFVFVHFPKFLTTVSSGSILEVDHLTLRILRELPPSFSLWERETSPTPPPPAHAPH